MKTIIGFSEFCDGFSDTHKNNFTYEGKRALFDYLEEYEEALGGEEIEYDPVSLCCEYTEYENATDCLKTNEYHNAPKKYTDEEALEWLQDNTEVITMEGQGIIILDF